MDWIFVGLALSAIITGILFIVEGDR